MSSASFIPQSSSTPKKIGIQQVRSNLCSTPRPQHVRCSLLKCAPRPVDCSTPMTKRMKKSAVPDLRRLIFSGISTTEHTVKVWVL